MPTNNILIHLFLVISFSIGLFDAVEALRCYYEQGRGQTDDSNPDRIKVVECREDAIGCNTIMNCDNGFPDERICTAYNNICHIPLTDGKTFGDNCKHCEFCSGDLCNDKGLEKTGLKCIGKGAGSDVAFVEECVTGHVACVAAWDCKGAPEKTMHGCSSDKNFCKRVVPNFDGHHAVNEVCNCHYCTSDLCNEGDIKEIPTLVGTRMQTSSNLPTTPKTEEVTKPLKPTDHKTPKTNPAAMPTPNSVDVDSTPKTDVGKPEDGEEETAAPANCASGLVIIPIVLLNIVLCARLIKMLTI